MVSNKKINISNIVLFCIYGMAIIIVVFFGLYTYKSQHAFYIETNEISMLPGESYQVQIIPEKNKTINYSDYTYKSKNPNVAIINKDGYIEPIGIGITEIEIVSKKGFSKEKIIVNILGKAIETITFNGNITLKKYETAKCYPIINEDSSIMANLTYKSENEDIVVVDEEGKIKALAHGTTRVYATAQNGVTGSVEVTVEKETIEAIQVAIEPVKLTLKVGDSKSLKTTIFPEDATNKTLNYISSNSSIVSVNQNGTITAKKEGEATIIVKTTNGLSATSKITVKAEKKNNTTKPGGNKNETPKPEENKNNETIKVSLNSSSINLKQGETYELKATITPDNAENKTITWKSSDTSIATVDNGKVTAKQAGTVIITATTVTGNKATCKVTIEKEYIEVANVELSQTATTLDIGNSVTLTAIVLPENATDKTVAWTSSNTNIITVDKNGKVTAKKSGSATITVKTSNGKTKECKVTVPEKSISAEKITLNKTSIEINIGKTETLTTTITPSNTTDKNVTWTTSDKNVATVSNGTITAKKVGTATITVKSSNGKKATCKVIVKDPNIYATSISLNKTSFSIEAGKTYNFTATILPENTTNKTIAWSSSNTSVITVNNKGQITAIKAGTAIITAKTSNGKKATCKITVKAAPVEAISISLNKTSFSMEVGKTYSFTATILPENTTNKTIAWSSSDTSIITVNNKGQITTIKTGTATITAKTSNGKKATCKITVKDKIILPTKVNFNKTTATMNAGGTLTIAASISPSNATDKTMTWSSSDESIATVDNGVVTARKTGTVTITATSINGKTNTCKITVNSPSNSTELCEYLRIHNKNKVQYDDFKKIINNNDDYYAIKAAHDCANKLDLPVYATKDGKYHIYKANSEDKTIVVKTSTNLNNATIYIHDENGIMGTSIDRQAIYTIENPEKALSLSGKASSLKGKVNANTKNISALAGYGNILVKVTNTNKKQFIRYGSNANTGDSQTEVFKVSNNGNVLNDIIWNFNDITNINASKIPSKALAFKNGNFITIASTAAGVKTTSGYAFRGIAVKRSKTTLTNINHTVVNSNKTKLESIDYTYYGFIQINFVSDITMNNCNLYALKTTKLKPNSTYDLIIEKSTNINIDNVKIPENQLSGYYWGVIATNYVKDITFTNCRLNRIDSHRGANNVTISNCTIGDRGLSLIGGGKLKISNTTVSGTPQFIRLREDYGSLWDGSIEITNSTLIPNSNNPSLISMEVPFDSNLIHYFGYDLVIPNVKVENFTIQKSITNFPIYDNSKTGLLGGNLSIANNYTGGNFNFTMPSSIQYSNITSTSGTPVITNYKIGF